MCRLYGTRTLCLTCGNVTASNYRVEYCFTTVFCEVECFLTRSESYQCSFCTTGLNPPPWSGVQDSSTEEIDLDERTYTITTGLDTAQPTPTRFYLSVEAMYRVRLRIQQLTSENEVERASRPRVRPPGRLRSRRENHGYNTSTNQVVSHPRRDVRRNTRLRSLRPLRSTVRTGIGESESERIATGTRDRRVGSQGRGNASRIPERRMVHIENIAEDQANMQESEDTRHGQHNDRDSHAGRDMAHPDGMNQELGIHLPHVRSQHPRPSDNTEARRRGRHFDSSTPRKLRGSRDPR